MPTYEYVCTKCEGRFERFQSISAEPETRCPECGGPVKRLIGAGAAVIMKGARAPACPNGSCPMAREGTCPGAPGRR